MGIFRKVTSLSTLGAVDYRSPKQKQRLAAAEESKANAQLARTEARTAAADSRASKKLAKAQTNLAKTGAAQGVQASTVGPEVHGASLASPPAPPPPTDVVEQLKGLADLRDRGVLSEDEFQAQKLRVLGQ